MSPSPGAQRRAAMQFALTQFPGSVFFFLLFFSLFSSLRLPGMTISSIAFDGSFNFFLDTRDGSAATERRAASLV